MKTVTISIDAARNAVTCIQAQALEGKRLVEEAVENFDHNYATVEDALVILRDLEASQIELLTALDSVEEEAA